MRENSILICAKLPLRQLTRHCLIFGLLLIEALPATTAKADGLIFALPPDGTWCEYSGETNSEISIELPKSIASKLSGEAKKQFDEMSGPTRHQGTIRLSSVGSETRAQRPCRWIEVSSTTKQLKSEKEQSPLGEAVKGHVLKLLIPERYLVRGEDPLANAILATWNQKDVDVKNVELEKGFNRIQYEIDRFRPVFPPTLDCKKTLPAVTINTPVGEFQDCEVITGTSHFDKPLLGDSRWEFTSEWELALHADAPYGVVRIQCKSIGKEITSLVTHIEMTYVHILSKVGEGATSTLQDQ